LHSVDLEDGVFRTVDVRVDTQTEEMLMIVRINTGVNFSSPAFGVFAWVHRIRVQDTSEFDFQLDGAVLVEDPVHAVFVVGGGEDVRDDEFATAGDDYGIVAEIGVFEENAGIFFVDADGVFDGGAFSGAVDEGGVHVVDCSFAVAPEGETVGHVSSSVFTKIEGVFALVRMFWVAVRDDHLSQGQSVKHWSDSSLVIICDVVEDNSLLVVEADVNIPVLPVKGASIDLERYTCRLCDVNRRNILPVSSLLFYACRVVVVGRSLVDRSSNFGDVDMDDFLFFRIENWAEVEREGILRIIHVRAVVHESLLQTNVITESVVITNCPC
jgi:hypothetical protein